MLSSKLKATKYVRNLKVQSTKVEEILGNQLIFPIYLINVKRVKQGNFILEMVEFCIIKVEYVCF